MIQTSWSFISMRLNETTFNRIFEYQLIFISWKWVRNIWRCDSEENVLPFEKLCRFFYSVEIHLFIHWWAIQFYINEIMSLPKTTFCKVDINTNSSTTLMNEKTIWLFLLQMKNNFNLNYFYFQIIAQIALTIPIAEF